MEPKFLTILRHVFAVLCFGNLLLHACAGAADRYGLVKGAGSMLIMALLTVLFTNWEKL